MNHFHVYLMFMSDFQLQVMYTSSFYANATVDPLPQLPDDFTVKKLTLEYSTCLILCKVKLILGVDL